MKLKTLIGKIVDWMDLNKDKDEFIIHFTNGQYIRFGVEGDCCSQSWIEHLEVPNDLNGATLLDVSNGGDVSWDNHECKESKDEDGDVAHECGHDCLQVYNVRFDTSKGSVILEFRNDSNGYYGGNLTVIDTNIPKQELKVKDDWELRDVSY